MGERMGGHDYLFIDERRETLKRSVKLALNLKAPPPVLLTFSAQMCKPSSACFFVLKTSKDRLSVGPESSPMSVRTYRMHRMTLWTPPSLHPQRIRGPVEVAFDIPMAPESASSAIRTSPQTWPPICFPEA